MEFIKFRKSWGASLRENAIKNVIIVIQAIIILVSVLGWFRSHETVVLVPPMLEERVSVSHTSASQGYKESWALAFTVLIGNITPGNVKFVIEKLDDFMAPDAYREIKKYLARQMDDIKSDSLSIQYEPKKTLYEKTTDKVFVSGDFEAKGPTGDPRKLYRTYEMKVMMRFGRPWVTDFDVYTGQAKTQNVLELEQVNKQASRG